MKTRAVLLLTTMLAAVLAAGGVVLAQAGEETVDAEALRSPAEADAALDRALEDLLETRGGPPGVIAIVQRGNDREVHKFGVANIANDRPITIEDRMRIASTAKAFSGAVALSLVSKGRLSLDDTVGERLPDLPEAWHEVTLRQLLNHTSGIADFSQDPEFQEDVRANLTNPIPPEELLSYVENEPLEPPVPGTEYNYSNSDNIAVALMVEAATERSYEEQLRRQVYEPLGLQKTSLPVGAELEPPYMHGYDNDPDAQPPEDYSETIAAGWAWASGGIVSTPADLNDFIRGYVGGELFDARTRAQQRRLFEGGGSEPPGPGANSAGLALFRYQTRCGTVWGHTGNTLGYTQFMAASSDGSRSVTVSINTQLTRTVGERNAFKALRQAEGRAVCAALAGK